ncbi:hypothetical protein [Sandaracinus amylolyticus]|uniref:Uncharacterized protein n=1 Tax=Sandaracinus amylolyticus TaxID=927083 RepID=A0A0F6YID0_9BACT|nr:hypothetical protein [Sandaracinus amylolyticus]AKF04972.1 hypothetical protein DB32_002121 [Sandaracinus amylolyticus]
MNHLTLRDLQMILAFLVRDRRTELEAAVGAAYARTLEETLAQIDALPAAVVDAPLSEELSAADAQHDAWGAAIHSLCNALLECPGSTPEERAGARAGLDFLLPGGLRELRDSYVTEVSRARERRAQLDTHRAELSAVRIGARTLVDWATAFFDAGDALGRLLVDRADSGVDRTPAIKLRGEASKRVTRARGLVEPSSAADQRLFGYLDTIVGMRAPGSKERAPAPPTPSEPRPT